MTTDGKITKEMIGEEVRKILHATLQLTPDQPIEGTQLISGDEDSSLGADELDVVEILTDLEECFEIQIPDDDAKKFVTVEAIITYIADCLVVQPPKNRAQALQLIKRLIHYVTNPVRVEKITLATPLRTAEGLYILPGLVISLAEHLGEAIGHKIERQYYDQWQTVGDVVNTVASYLRLKK
jgi:acyl carrier protein